MEFGFDYGTLAERCRMLSSYEAAEMTDGNGGSAFLGARIAASDRPLLAEYFNAAALDIEEDIARTVVSASHTAAGFVWNLRLGTRWRGSGRELRGYVEEAVTAYAMARWLDRKGEPARASVYRSLWEDMRARCSSVVFRLSAPVKEHREGREDAREDARENGQEHIGT